MRSFHLIAANDAMSSDAEGDERTHCIFRNMATRLEFDMVIGFVPGADQNTSVTWVLQADALMTSAIKDLQRRLKEVAQGVGNRLY